MTSGNEADDAGGARLTETADGRYELCFERRLAHPPEKVWRAITEWDQLRSWFPAVVEFDLRPGAPLRFGVTEEQVRRYGMPADHVAAGTMLRVEPPNLVEFSWAGEILRWELTADGAGGCVLVFRNIFDDRDIAAPAAAGWHAGLEVVIAQLDGMVIDWSPLDRADELGPEYTNLVPEPRR
ncbi:uncharacterized protein YndB with AHSA1/START domain [Tamaricihabitans halophyticus]|uniref:Uncharacterized protein YndB with AHSA1/START domain n=1 Tax=Tamaricihabitans halophyticus TaxID=1262583 RepID=A0A4R2R179_9PSEU|nr:SRPBCC domain-containing protein [Tamaricihabitans halophyticus]TCP55238.1 uncharacterized protein YndB with AHSA1/START domain [Tamaricihabitans halophyticus]